MQATMNPELIEKESISSLNFKEKFAVEQHPELMKQIEQATILGNSHRSKVSIIFQDDNGLKRVDTTIWAAGTKFVCLKGGVWIPIQRIREIKF
jgi:DNA-binding transcriptional regulator of glucitol operon